MLIQTVPNTAGLTIPGAPVLAYLPEDKTLASLAGLRYVVDPASPQRERKRNLQLIGSTNAANLPPVAAAAPFGGLPAWQMTAVSTSQIKLPNTERMNSITHLMAVYMTSQGGLVGNGSLLRVYYHTTANMMRFSPINLGGTASSAATMLPINTLGIVGVSFDYATLKSSFLLPNGSWTSEYTHTQAPNIEDTASWADYPIVIGSGGGSNSSAGHFGMCLMFDRALHLPANASTFAAALGALKAKYGIA